MDERGHSYVVAEFLSREQNKEDNFLTEVGVKVYKRTDRYKLFEDDLYTVSLSFL